MERRESRRAPRYEGAPASVLVALERDEQRDFVADIRDARLHAEVRALDLTSDVATAAFLGGSRSRIAFEALDRELQRLGHAEQRQIALDRRRVVARERDARRLVGHLGEF